MKKFLLFFVSIAALLLGVLPAYAVRTNLLVEPLTSVTATGALNDADASVYTRTGSFNLIIKNSAGTNPTMTVKLQQGGVPAANVQYVTAGTTINKLRAGATTTVKLAAKFTQSGAKSVKYVDLWIRKTGTITSGKLLTLNVDTDSSGVPSDTSLGASSTVGTDSVASTFAWVRFTFPIAVDLSDATVYHLVLTGDYTASTSNYIDWNSNTVASAGNAVTSDNTTWTAVTTESFNFIVLDTAFTDITGGAFTQVTTAASHQILSFSLDGAVGGLVRPYATIGGTSNPAFYLAVLLNAELR